MSSTRPDPFELPEWRALHREASLVSQIIGSGATALGRASYASGFGEYYTAFFGLSIGIERLCKLILVANWSIDNNGKLPDQKVVRRFGHDLTALVKKVVEVSASRNLALQFPEPDEPICWSVLNCLDAFANASKGRYANFEAIGNPSFNPADEPVQKWWDEVVEPILNKHLRGRRSDAAIKGRAQIIGSLLSPVSSILFFDESGNKMTDVSSASERTGQTAWAQKYGRFYALMIVRWLSDVFGELSEEAVYKKNIDALFGHYEYFSTYRVENKFLLYRKLWPLT